MATTETTVLADAIDRALAELLAPFLVELDADARQILTDSAAGPGCAT